MDKEVRMQARRITVGAGLIGIAALGLMLSCSEERPLQPTPMSYLLHVFMKSPLTFREGYILSVDCESDSIVDSLHVSGLTNSWEKVYTSPSSPIMVVPDEGVHKVYDPRSRTFLAEFDYHAVGVAFFPELGRLVATAGRTLVLEDTTYTARAEIACWMWNCKRIGNTSRVIGQCGYGSSVLVIADVLTGAIIDSFRVDNEQGSGDLTVPDFEISPDGTRIYAVVREDKSWLLGYDLRTKKSLFWYPHAGDTLSASGGSCYISPGGDEVWATWGANIIGRPWPTSVYVLDAFSGALRDTIDLSPTRLGWPDYTAPNQVRFVPNQAKAYVSCGYVFTGEQPVVAVNTDNYEVEMILFANSGRMPRQTAIGPAR